MSKHLVLTLCRTFQKEVETIMQTQQWEDVELQFLPEVCRYPHLRREAEESVLHWQSDPNNEVMVIGCYADCMLGKSDKQSCYHQLDLCLNLIHPANLTSHQIETGGYLVTPGWLNDWQEHLARWGLDQATARAMYQESAKKIVLLDTFTNQDSPQHLQSLGEYLDLPIDTIPVGLDYMRLYLEQIINAWRNQQNVADLRRMKNESNQISADYAMAMDLLTNLAQIRDEDKAIVEVLDLFTMLFSAQTVLYFPVHKGEITPRGDHSITEEVFAEIDHWLHNTKEIVQASVSGAGFLLRLNHRGETIGILRIEGLKLPEYQSRYINLSVSIANLCGLAINNARMYRQLQDAEQAALRAREVSDTLRGVLSDLVLERELKEVLRKSLESLHPIIDFSKAFIYLLKDGKYSCQVSAAYTVEQQGLSLLPVVPFCSFSESQAAVMDEEFSTVVFSLLDLTGSRSILLPLTAHSVSIGFLVLSADNELSNSLSRVNLLHAFADEISIAVENARLFEEIEQMATRDGLTGIFNRRHFYALATIEFKRSKRYNSPLSAIMLDVDFFKMVNDTYGHPVGDQVLMRIASICQENMRSADLLGRYGGEEFVFLLPETAAAEAFLVAERIRGVIASSSLKLNTGEEIQVTASLGIAGINPLYGNIEEMLAHCDEALYRAKQSGRNCTLIYAAEL